MVYDTRSAFSHCVCTVAWVDGQTYTALASRGAVAAQIWHSPVDGDGSVEEAGAFGTLWAALGMSAYFMALTWINILLGLILSPLFLIPMSWLKSRQGGQPKTN